VALYLNGVLAAADSNVTIPMTGVQDVRNIVGADNWPDAGMQGTIEEFRIYNGALQPVDIVATHALGPNQLLSTTRPILSTGLSGGNLILTWPLASSGFNVQWATNLLPAAWSNGLPTPQIVGGCWQVSVPISVPQVYYRLAR
jgi:hypothetical protein